MKNAEMLSMRDKCINIIKNINTPPVVEELQVGFKIIFATETELFELEVDDDCLDIKTKKELS